MAAAPQVQIDDEQAQLFLKALGKNGNARLRAFSPWKGQGRKSHFDLPTAQHWQLNGLGVYLVINNGGDTDESIDSCIAFFIEWDDQPTDWQITAWQELNLPEPSLQVFSGGKSIHNYWILSDPISPDRWRNIQERLIDHTQSDPKLKNPSRVMRLPGTWHISTGSEAPRVRIDDQVKVIHDSGCRYSADDIEAALPPSPTPTPARPIPLPSAPLGTVDLQDLLPKDQHQLFNSGALEGGRNDAAYKLACSLLAIQQHCSLEGHAALGFTVRGNACDALNTFNQRCSPPLPQSELDTLLASASQGNPNPDLGLSDRLAFHRRQQRSTTPTKTLVGLEPPDDDDDIDGELSREAHGRYLQAQQATIDLNEVFGPFWGQLLIDRAAAFPCDPSMLLLPMLSYIASLVGTKASVKVKAGWTEALVIWGLIAQPASSLKSPVGGVFGKPLAKLQGAAQRRFDGLNDTFQSLERKWKADCRGIEATAKKNGTTPELPEPPQPPTKPRHYFVDSVTIERLASIQSQSNVPGVLSFQDELADWFSSLERNSKTTDRAKWLKLWNGGALKHDTATSTNAFAESSAISIVGFIQPDKLAALHAAENDSDEDSSGDGLWARFLPLIPRTIPFSFNDLAVDITEDLVRLAAQLDQIPTETTLLIHPAAIRDVLSPAWDRWVNLENESGAARAAFIGKLRGYSVRLSGILHLLHQHLDTTIAMPTAITAVHLCDFFLAQFDLLAPQITQKEEVSTLTAKFLARVHDRNLQEIRVRDLQRWRLLGRDTTAKEATSFLFGLAAQGIGTFEQLHTKGSKRGAWAWKPSQLIA